MKDVLDKDVSDAARFDELTSFRIREDGWHDLFFREPTIFQAVNGGYIAAAALRIAGAAAKAKHPASITCHFLRPIAPGSARARLSSVVRSITAELAQVDFYQNDRLCAVAHVWVTAYRNGPTHREARMPLVPHPDELSRLEDIMRKDEPQLPPFWRVFDQRPINRIDPRSRIHRSAQFLRWFRYRGAATFACQFLDTARTLPIIDVMGVLAAGQMYDEPFLKETTAATIQLTVCFHDIDKIGEWLLSDAFCSYAGNGLIGTHVSAWSLTGSLVAQGVSQLVTKTIPSKRSA